MGKTIQTLALLVSDRTKPNLIVAYVICLVERVVTFPTEINSFRRPHRPTVAILQWRNEIESFTDGFKIAIWHGASRESNMDELQKYDVVSQTCIRLSADELMMISF